jgi:response regulator RpfG family c-di-GMP phosphodiesterase
MENKKLIDTLYFCAAQCTHCYDACQREKEKENLNRCIALDEECADICRLTATRLEKSSENSEKFLRLCAEICESCAAECEKHTHMEHCKKCAEACRTCAEMCLQPVEM